MKKKPVAQRAGGQDLKAQNGMSGRGRATRGSGQTKPSLQCHLLEVLKHVLDSEEGKGKLVAEDMEKESHKATGEVTA